MGYFASPDFQSLVELMIKQHHVPGLAIAVIQDDKISSAGYGKARLDPPEPCTADTLFDIASCSKSFTAASIGLLVEDKETYSEVQYTATMSSLLPDDFVMPSKEYTDGVAVDDVLGHRSGMGRHDLSYLGPRAKEPDTPRSVTRNLRNLTTVAPLRSKYIYNNMMYTVLTQLLEVKTQQPFSDLLQKRFFDPLGMSSSTLQPASARERGLGDRLAMGYAWDKPSKSFHGFEMADCPEAQGAGSIITSANDLILWVKALINREGPISEEMYQGLVRLRSLTDPRMGKLKRYKSPTFYAAGLEVYFYRGHVVVRHDGEVPGFASRFFFLPDLEFGAVLMGNSSEAGLVVSTLANKLIDKVTGVPEGEVGQKKDKGLTEMNVKTESKAQNKEKDPEAKPEPKQPRDPPEPQETPLEAYTGDYWNPGYHTFTVEVKDGKLFIDATDRSMGWTLTFEHVSNQTEYIAHLNDMYEGGDEGLEAKFEFDGEKATKMALQLEWGSKEIMWFAKV